MYRIPILFYNLAAHSSAVVKSTQVQRGPCVPTWARLDLKLALNDKLWGRTCFSLLCGLLFVRVFADFLSALATCLLSFAKCRSSPSSPSRHHTSTMTESRHRLVAGLLLRCSCAMYMHPAASSRRALCEFCFFLRRNVGENMHSPNGDALSTKIARPLHMRTGLRNRYPSEHSLTS